MNARDRIVLEVMTILARGRDHARAHRDYEHLDLTMQLAQRRLRDLLDLDE